jgi:hypothetical protein
MIAYRCSNCNLTYPGRAEFQTCVQCTGKCWLNQSSSISPLSEEEIQALKEEKANETLKAKRLLEFEEFCKARDKRLLTEQADAIASDAPLYAEDI